MSNMTLSILLHTLVWLAIVGGGVAVLARATRYFTWQFALQSSALSASSILLGLLCLPIAGIMGAATFTFLYDEQLWAQGAARFGAWLISAVPVMLSVRAITPYTSWGRVSASGIMAACAGHLLFQWGLNHGGDTVGRLIAVPVYAAFFILSVRFPLDEGCACGMTRQLCKSYKVEGSAPLPNVPHMDDVLDVAGKDGMLIGGTIPIAGRISIGGTLPISGNKNSEE